MDGTIVISRVRPISYIAQVILQALSRTVMLAVTFVLPLFLVGILIGHIPVTAYGLGIAIGVFLIGFTLFSLISFLVGTIAIIITNVRGIMQIVTSLIVIAAGGAIPLIMLPPYLANIAFALPFQTMGYLPTAAIMGIATPSAIANGIIIGCIWIVALFIISFFWWGRVSKKITSVGG
jgi:ABC-2 type transport system permease protein